MTAFEANLAIGRRYELAMASWLQYERGFAIIPMYDLTGAGNDKAPRMFMGRHYLTLPDILGLKDEEYRWFEIKWKERAGFYRKDQKQTTGINLVHWNEYREVKRLSGSRTYLIFIHQQEQRVVYGELSQLPVLHTYSGTKMNRTGGMVFFDFAAMEPLMNFDQLNRYMTKQGL